MWGYDNKDEIIGKSILDFWTDSKTAKKMIGIMEENNCFISELKAKKKNNEIFYAQLSSSVIKDDSGVPVCMMASFIDISKEKELHQQLIQSEKFSAVGQLSAGIAHEFNNLLAIIISNSNLMIMSFDNLPEDILDSIRTNIETAKRGANIVENMLNFTRPKTPKREYVKIEDIINRVLDFQKSSFEFEHIKVETNYKGSDTVFCDEGQIEQVVLNMIINARHAILCKGKGKIKISSYTKNDNLIFTIQDDGIGMAEEETKKIFTPFYTTKGAFAKNYLGIQGSGLGLSVSYKIIESHKGTITVESEKDIGTKFIISLPLQKEIN